jgi:hypothetical protein
MLTLQTVLVEVSTCTSLNEEIDVILLGTGLRRDEIDIAFAGDFIVSGNFQPFGLSRFHYAP